MSKCETCARKKYGYLCDGCIHDPDNKDLYEPMTNADHIRSMTDEELANIIECPYGNPYFDEHLPCKGSCHDCLLIWLQQPAEEAEYD